MKEEWIEEGGGDEVWIGEAGVDTACFFLRFLYLSNWDIRNEKAEMGRAEKYGFPAFGKPFLFIHDVNVADNWQGLTVDQTIDDGSAGVHFCSIKRREGAR